MMAESLVEIDYTNWRGRRGVRQINPDGTMLFGSNEWHPEPQWLLGALDMNDGKYKLFALAGIHSWKAVTTKPYP